MNQPAIAGLRRRHRFLKTTAVVVTVSFLGLTLQPLALAANLPSRPAAAKAKPPSNEAKLARHIETIETKLDQLDTKLNKKESGAKEQGDIKILRQELDALDIQARADFDQIEKHLKDKNLPQVIRDRHLEAVRAYQKEMAALKANLDDIGQAKDDTERKGKAKKARDHLKAKQKKRAQQPFDPNDMPNKSLRPDPKNKPKLKKSEFVRAGLHNNPYVKLAVHGSFQIDQLPGASDPAYLAATTEITLTDAIRAKAVELEHNPVKIYNWVRNNVEWLPTWGATQDADVTLGSQRGNAFDIASLLIALYRASDIPARYVHGTVEVPEDKFRNWTGGFTNINAAADYAASGGIPVTTIISGGKITKVQLEHIWVEAAIDFNPSRGAINKSADRWVALDASYKQYEDLQGLDVVAIAGLDPTALAQSFANSGTVNEQEGWVTGLNPAILENAQTQAQTALENYIANNLPNPTVGDVIGGRKIIPLTRSVLATNLPNRTMVIGARYGTIPSGLQHTMTFAFGRGPLGELVNPVTFPWPKLNNHKVTLSFRPATAADEQALTSLLPEGPITDPSQLPSSIPSYLVFVIPEIALNGQVVGQGTAMRLGEILSFYYGIARVNGLGSHTSTYLVPAGSYLNVAVAGGSVSAPTIDTLRMKRQQTEAVLRSGNSAAIAALTREDIMGDTFQAGTLGYFSQYIAQAHIASLPQQARHVLPSGYGTLGYEPNVQTLFGFPRAITPGGVAVNVRLQWVIESLDGDATKRPQLSLQTGLLSSAIEHAVPEQMFSTRDQPKQGVSAVKALQIAAQQGQRIYHITPAIAAQVLPDLNLDSLALSEINQALATGKEVIAHTDRIIAPGFIGEGYILFDPVTGDGAYKITGGSNGSFFNDFLNDMNLLATVFSFLAAIAAFSLIGFGLSATLLLAFSTLLAAIGVALTIWYVFDATGSIGSALVGGIAAVVAAIYIGAVVNALVWSILAGTTILAAILFLFVVTVIVSALLAFLIWLLTSSLPSEMRRRMFANNDQWKKLVCSNRSLVVTQFNLLTFAT